ncbi:cytochrome P450 2F5-like [Chiloscyllium plagiosum]|uniref:cytochrome P450 2F5-like n=1 Tax=Chiloscyllium plagiosum TaxID=36176 RepID=UPI001CB80962|nr:cytochrome P450 2F5-like [Chiloscyllium plagiosum]
MIDSYEGQPFNPTVQLNAAAANIICSIIFGDRFDYEDETFVSLIKRVNENAQLLGSPIAHVSLILHLNSNTLQKKSFAICSNGNL